MSNRKTKICWLDLETEGADAATCLILEVGMVVTTVDLQEVERYEGVVGLNGATDPDYADAHVRVIHVANGLDALVRASTKSSEDVEREAIGVLSRHGKPGEFILAGSGVGHFDKRFLANQMPVLHSWFRYYVYDVGVVRRLLVSAGRADLVGEKPNKPHRALGDALLHLEEWRRYVALVQGIPFAKDGEGE